MPPRNVDQMRAGILDGIEAANRRMRTFIIAAALIEAGLLAGAILVTVWKDPIHRLVIAVGTGTWTLIALGFWILGAHVSRVGSQIVAALTPDG